MKQWLVVACLKLVGNYQNAVIPCLDLLFNLRGREAVKRRFTHRISMIIVVASKCHYSCVGTVTLLQQFVDLIEIVNGTTYSGGDYHCTSLATNLVSGDIVEMLHDDFCFFCYSLRLALHKGT